MMAQIGSHLHYCGAQMWPSGRAGGYAAPRGAEKKDSAEATARPHRAVNQQAILPRLFAALAVSRRAAQRRPTRIRRKTHGRIESCRPASHVSGTDLCPAVVLVAAGLRDS